MSVVLPANLCSRADKKVSIDKFVGKDGDLAICEISL